jgi:hypothetical protein
MMQLSTSIGRLVLAPGAILHVVSEVCVHQSEESVKNLNLCNLSECALFSEAE